MAYRETPVAWNELNKQQQMSLAHEYIILVLSLSMVCVLNFPQIYSSQKVRNVKIYF